MNSPALTRYRETLPTIPPPGIGANCHGRILAVANHGVRAGLTPEQIHDDLLRAIPPGKRRLPNNEIPDAIKRALSDFNGGTFVPRPQVKPIVQDGKKALRGIINSGKISQDFDLWESSSIRLWDEPHDDPALLLSILYEPDDLIWIGERHEPGIMDVNIRCAKEWRELSKSGAKLGPHFCINPLNGIPSPKKSGDGTTLRGDANVKMYRYCLIEFDGLDRESQIKFFSAVKLPIRALIDSGNKSIHALVDVQKLAKVETVEQWQIEIKPNLYDRLLVPLGIDGACSNPARLSRLPGHYREENQAYQRLLWLSAEGRTIC